ncbi:bicaudal C homolog 2 [Thalassophryne amazonica]|uniref:bicaudal C homolog 2 n=1 Tax=Thalassophryne amazonica TaxID=390379 RepID=UPI001471DE1B|nr:bicaudal C homolog 2 [Thalassophryne amazonica]
MATVTEGSSPVPGTNAPQRLDLELSSEPGSAETPELRKTLYDRQEKEGEEEEDGKGSGLSSDPEWLEERFRIDRKKLENMLYAPKQGGAVTGEEFFERVMRETDTLVKWPSKLKIGAKSKKDPHVKVEGRRINVLEAKKKILEVLETRVNKVTLKMDVAYTEHSHVIGKGGGNIKNVMEVTSCHIHFPDSNRHSATGEKSNQVSIAGPIEGVEEARRRIRDLQPLALTFDLPVSIVPQDVPDAGSPLIQQLVQTLGVSVSFRAVPPQPQMQPQLYGNCCTIWGLQGNAAAVKKAACILMDLLLGAEVVGQTAACIVSSQLDVTSQQHLFLLGQNGAHFLSVMHQTHTQIILPDLSAPQNPPSLLIQGSPDGVCLARQQLMDCLPVCLMFDMRDDGEADTCKLAQMMQNLGVFISIKPKLKQTSKSVVVKGLEKNISCLYEARRLLLGLDSCESTKVIEMTRDPVLSSSGLTSYWLNLLLQQLHLSEQGEQERPTSEVQSGSKPHPSPPPGLAPPAEEGRNRLKGTDGHPLEKISENEDQSGQSEDETSKVTAMASCETCEASSSSRVAVTDCRGSLQGPEPIKVFSQGRRHSTGQTLIHRLLNSDIEDVKRHSLRRGMTPTRDACTDSLEAEDYDYEKKKLLATRAMQRKPVVTEVRTPTNTWSGLGFSKSMPSEAVQEMRSVNRRCYKRYLTSSASPQQSWAAPTVKDKICNRSDSNNWRERRGSTSSSLPMSSSNSSSSSCSPSSSPSNFSSSTPSFPAFISTLNRSRDDNKPSESFPSSFFEGVCSSRRASNCSLRSPSPQITDDLPELLSQLGLMKYIDVFEQQEIDYQTFLTLSDEDLKEVGVATFGARRKMLLAISDLNKSKRSLSDTSTVKSGYLEGGASGRLPRIIDIEVTAQSKRW